MIQYCYEKWKRHEDKLRKALSKRKDLGRIDYQDLVKITVTYILNPVDEDIDSEVGYNKWSTKNIVEVTQGDYQGTLVYLIPADVSQPDESEYLMTYIGYGSCSVCDTLQGIQTSVPYDGGLPNKQAIDDFMTLCRDIVCNTIKPYNKGWQKRNLFDPVNSHGKWEKHKVVVDGEIVESKNSFVCSRCKDIWTTTTKMKYCPSCGAENEGMSDEIH